MMQSILTDIDIPLDKKYKPHYLKQDARRDADDKEIEQAKEEQAKKERADSSVPARVRSCFNMHIILSFDQSDL